MAKHSCESSALQEPQYQQNATFLSDVLYCAEESWEDDEEETTYYTRNNSNRRLFPILLEQDLSWDDEELSTLFSKEEQNQLYKNLETNSFLVGARCEAVQWMLKVNAYYSFTALTAVLAVNYLDRFLVSFHLQPDKPWRTQLAALACLSLAAKVEETQVPLLLDLQVEDTRYVFDVKTIQRMEILVLSTLRWKMNPVTPLSFLDYITRRLGLKDLLCWETLRRCERIILSVISDSRSMHYLPSVVATATMLQVINDVEPCLGTEYETHLLGILGIQKDKVADCCELIVELAPKDNHGSQSNKRKCGSSPGSPKGVMDLNLSFSSDSSNDSWSVSSSPEPLSKKGRAVQSLNHSTADVLNNPY
ncbi:hypothetical protein K2173_026170 [Erythroxylum novogranatense]|uniref:B-like cyclin n=1 Tax=Erythroxylum novogranatense TaxID=1862640 RepID=A0AAV8TAC2_9ROSI|nr:hypothetical protein K2173_026170 [Erythroxylum novogranatense]